MALIPLNRARLIEELEIVREKLYFLGGDSTGSIMQKTNDGWTFRNDDRAAFMMVTRIVNGPAEKITRADEYRRAFDVHGKILCTCRRRLVELLNQGDVELFDVDHDTIETLRMAWSVVEQLPGTPVKFQVKGKQTLLSVSTFGTLVLRIVIDDLTGEVAKKAYYLGDGLVQVGTVRHVITGQSNLQVLEQLVKDRVATTSSFNVSNAAKTIADLRKVHSGILAPHISTSGKAKQGYSTTIEDGRPIRELLDRLASR